MGDGLQFDHAEYQGEEKPKAPCGVCKTPIPDQYFVAGKTLVCPGCKVKIERSFTGGNAILRVVKATVFGIGAGLAGAFIYFAVLYFFKMNLALITILIGIMVAKAVRYGSENRGGLGYQFLAVGITYFSMTVAFTPIVFPMAHEQVAKLLAEDIANHRVSDLVVNVLAFAQSFLGCVFMPLYQAQAGEVIAVLIYFFGLRRAWIGTAKLVIEFQGPYGLAKPAPATAGVA